MKRTLCLLLLLISVAADARPRFRIFNFELGGIRVKPQNWDTSAYVDLAWTPMWDGEDFGFHGLAEVTGLKDQTDQRRVVTGYGMAAFLRFYSLFNVEVGGGVKTWHSSTVGTNPYFGGGILLRVAENLFDRLYILYNWYLIPGNTSGEFRVGTSFSF